MGQELKAAQVAKQSHLRRTKKSDRTIGSPKVKPSTVPQLKVGVMLFWFDILRSKSLVPHWQFIEQNNNLKRVSPESHRIYVPMFKATGGGNTPRIDEWYYCGQPCGASTYIFLQSQRKQKAFIEPKIKKTVRSLNVKPPPIARSKAAMALFILTSVEAKIEYHITNLESAPPT
jgi:hypothetical protein